MSARRAGKGRSSRFRTRAFVSGAGTLYRANEI